VHTVCRIASHASTSDLASASLACMLSTAGSSVSLPCYASHESCCADISGERLQEQLIEVFNKEDLLSAFMESEDQEPCQEGGSKEHQLKSTAIAEGASQQQEHGYDVQPRNINANVEWVRDHSMGRKSSPVLLTSAVTGQGLHRLMAEIDLIIESRREKAGVAECFNGGDGVAYENSKHMQKDETQGVSQQKKERGIFHVRDAATAASCAG
jgi:hypothetical protein